MNANLLSLQIKLEALITERKAYEAVNKTKKYSYYGEQDFLALQSKIEALSNVLDNYIERQNRTICQQNCKLLTTCDLFKLADMCENCGYKDHIY